MNSTRTLKAGLTFFNLWQITVRMVLFKCVSHWLYFSCLQSWAAQFLKPFLKEKTGYLCSGQAWLIASISNSKKNTPYLRVDLKYNISYDCFTINDSWQTLLSYTLALKKKKKSVYAYIQIQMYLDAGCSYL